MKKVLFALLLAASVASAQVYPPDASSGTATSVSPSAFPLLAPDGSGSAPSYSFTNNTDAGLYILGTTIYLQNQDTLTGGRAYAQFGGEVATIHATLGADTGNFGQFSCQQNTDMYCFVNATDGVNSSLTTFNNTGTTFSDTIYLPDGAAATPSLTFTSDTNAGLYAFAGTGVALSNASGAEAVRIYDNFAGLRSANGSDTAEFQAQGNYLSSGDPLAIMKVWDAGNTAQNDFWCTHRDAEEGCHLGVDDGTNTSDVRFHPTYTSFTVPVQAADGTGANKAFSFTGNTDMGLRRNVDTLYIESGDVFAPLTAGYIVLSSNVNYLSVRNADTTDNSVGVRESGGDGEGAYMRTNGVERYFFGTANSKQTVPLQLPDGTAAAPSLTFTSQTDAGLNYQDSINTITLQTSEAPSYARLSMNGEAGTGTPYFQLDADDATKDVSIVGNAWSTLINLSADDGAGASSTTIFYKDRTEFSDPVYLPTGSQAAPALTFGDTDTGLYGSAGTVNISINNTSDGASFSAENVSLNAEEDAGDGDTQIEMNSNVIASAITLTASDTGTSAGVTVHGTSEHVELSAGGKAVLRADYVSATETYLDLLEDAAIRFEGATDDANETTISPVDPTADRTINLPNEDGYLQTVQQGTSTLTDNTATNILSFPLADGVWIAGTLVTVTTCIDASNTVVRHDTSDWICTNAADTESCTFGTNLGAALQQNDGAGTLNTHTLAVSTAGTNEVRFTLQADCSYASITTLESDWEIEFHYPDWAAVTELN
ncbi:MAG: hypothetical protein GTO63_15710 [Anaerolineae bacterium]|nr:hypothetical protein [Anaerolineae bacterium]NIN96275.1 hypothetical protein [Anaerolineae bacterium]NIQ79295.1 hypothetical protein [Anaerolineae bacterium]